MKKITFLIIFNMIFICLFSQGISFYHKIDLNSIYHSNILKYSKGDIDEFTNSLKPEKYYIKSIDDLYFSIKGEMGIKHRYFAGHTQIAKFLFRYKKYLQNSIKDGGFVAFSLKQYFSDKLNLSLFYYYYPEIYLKHYASVLDDANIYHEFSYSKNSYLAKINWKIFQKVSLNYKFEFAQSFYNKYFTEYDADNFINAAGVELNPNKNIKMDLKYTYTKSKAQAEEAFQNPDEISTIKDASYESNKYFCSFTIPELFMLSSSHLRFFASLKFEEKFFQSNLREDSYHYGREDNIFTVDSYLQIPVWTELSLRTSYKFESRNTYSGFSSVSRDKEYSYFEVGTSLQFRF